MLFRNATVLRSFVASLVVASAAGIVAARPVHDSLPGSWLMYQGRPDHNAVFSRSGYRKRWVFDSGARINSGLAVVGSTLYFDTFDGDVIALDSDTGHQRWRTRFDNIIMSTPVVADGSVFVGTGHNGPASAHETNFVYAAEVHQSSLPMWGRPEGDHIVALDAATGSKRWSYRTAGEDMPSPVYAAGRLIFVNGDFNAYALRAGDGGPLWQREVGGLATMASANRAGDAVIASTCSGPAYKGHTLALDPSTGDIRWRSTAGDCDSAPTVGAGRVFVSGVDGNVQPYGYGARGTVAALDASRGSTVWRYVTPESGPYTKIGSNERAIAGCYDNGSYYQAFPTVDRFAAFDARDGHVRWLIRTAAPVKMSAIAVSGRIYFGDTAGLFYSVDAATGKVIRIRMFDAPFTVSPPVAVGDTVFAVNGTKVVAFQP